jgi:putative ABC transport system permease protein
MVKTQSQAAFTQTTTGFDAVLGARGSKLQLVLNAIFHLEASPGNMAWADYEMIRSGTRR